MKTDKKKTQIEKNESTVYKNGELFEMYNNLANEDYFSDSNDPRGLSGIQLLYAMNRNIKILKPIAESIHPEKSAPLPDAMKEYNKEHEELIKSLCLNEDGTYRIKNVMNERGVRSEAYDFDVNGQEYLKAKAVLNKKYEKAFTVRREQNEKYNDFLNADSVEKLNLFYVPLSALPANITSKQYHAIAWMVLDMTEEQEKKFNELFKEIQS